MLPVSPAGTVLYRFYIAISLSFNRVFLLSPRFPSTDYSGVVQSKGRVSCVQSCLLHYSDGPFPCEMNTPYDEIGGTIIQFSPLVTRVVRSRFPLAVSATS